MRHPKLVASLAAFTLTIGGLALAGPALAEEPIVSAAPSTQEVASSPDTSTHTTSPSTSLSATGQESTSIETLAEETATPPAGPVADPVQPTETTPTIEPSPTLSSSFSSTDVGTGGSSNSKGHDPVTLCHKPGTPAQQALTVDDNAVKGHLAHGDTLGECAPLPTPVEGWWLMPNGGTGENVTWPQTATSPNVIPCGVTAQVDLYPSQAVLDQLAADGVLEQGEDYSTVISWRFVYGGDCPPRPEDVTKIIDDHETTDCDAGTITHVVTEQTTTWTWNAETVTWDAVLSEPVTTATTREADAESCPPVVIPPTEPPVVVPPLHTAPASAPEQQVAKVVSTDMLAETGSDESAKASILVGGAVLIILGIIAVVVIRRRVPKQK